MVSNGKHPQVALFLVTCYRFSQNISSSFLCFHTVPSLSLTRSERHIYCTKWSTAAAAGVRLGTRVTRGHVLKMMLIMSESRIIYTWQIPTIYTWLI